MKNAVEVNYIRKQFGPEHQFTLIVPYDPDNPPKLPDVRHELKVRHPGMVILRLQRVEHNNDNRESNR